ncbi:MAG: amidohydrolase, partial [bacterium]
MWIVDGGHAYRRANEIKNTGAKLITTLNFPDAPNVGTIEDEANVELQTLKHWDIAPENAARLAKAGIDFALTVAALKKKDKFLGNLRTAVKRGLDADKALAALTTTP